VDAANDSVPSSAGAGSGPGSMGTTLVALATRATVLGCSRWDKPLLSRARRQLERLTLDHSLVDEQVR